MDKNPFAFMSYTRFDDEHDNGRLTVFRKRLSAEVQMQTGAKFEIFQDIKDIACGQSWKCRIDEAIATATFFIPVLTPRFFTSRACRYEADRFLTRESVLGRKDLMLPFYYVTCPVLEDVSLLSGDALAKLISERHYFDWRKMRFEPTDSLQWEKMVAELATQIAKACVNRTPGREQISFAALPADAHGPEGGATVRDSLAYQTQEAGPQNGRELGLEHCIARE